MMSTELRRKMIDKDHEDLSVLEQCNLLALPRSTLYYTPLKAYSERDLLMMRALDELHLEDPTRGTRRMRTALIKRGYKVGRRHVRTLMQIMRIRAVYARPRTTVIDPGKYKYPLFAKRFKNCTSQSGLGYRYHLRFHAKGLYVSDCDHRPLQQIYCGLEPL